MNSYITLTTLSILISMGMTLPSKRHHQRITAQDGRSSLNEVRDEFENPVIVDSVLEEAYKHNIDTTTPLQTAKKHSHKPHKHHHHHNLKTVPTTSINGNGGGEDNDSGRASRNEEERRESGQNKIHERETRKDESQKNGRRRGRNMDDSDLNFRPLGNNEPSKGKQSAIPKPYGTMVSMGKNRDPKTVVLDLRDEEYTEEDSLETMGHHATPPPPPITRPQGRTFGDHDDEPTGSKEPETPPTTTTTIIIPIIPEQTPTTPEVTTIYRAPTTELLDISDENDITPPPSPRTPSPPVPTNFRPQGRTFGDHDDESTESQEPSTAKPTPESQHTVNQTNYGPQLIDLSDEDDMKTFVKPEARPPPPTTTTTTTTASTRRPTTREQTPNTPEVTTVYRPLTTEVLDLDESEEVTPPPPPFSFQGRSFGDHESSIEEPSTSKPTSLPKSQNGSETESVAKEKKDIKLVQEAGYRPEAKTKSGIFRGLIMNLENDKKVFTFYGISYATPPVDTLRFKPPIPVGRPTRDGAFEATTMNPPCFPSRIGRSSTSVAVTLNKEQKDNQNPNYNSMTVASEDCLYLNMWLPDKVVLDDQPGKSTLYPVLIWIHGEGFLSGMDKEDYKSAAQFVAVTDIILIAIQYRLGVFGFLHMGSTESLGNMGLQDQVEALKWIEENIEYFGGNPHSVTIMGHDIGASFVGYHLISKISPGYFNRAVMIGGAPLQPHMFHTRSHASRMAMELATQLGCVNSKSAKSILECLLNMDPVSIWEVQIFLLQQGHSILAFPFVPTEDGTVLSGPPIHLLENGRGKTCQVLLGSSSNEGSHVLLNSVEGILSNSPTYISYDKFLTILRQILDMEFTDLEMDTVMHQYKNWKNVMDGHANQIKAADAIGDFYFTCPLRKFSDLWSARGLPTYHFSFSHQSSVKNRSSWIGTLHGDELDYLFGVPLRFPGQFSSEEVELSKKMMKTLENFIKMGNPDEHWERYGKETPHFAEFIGGGSFYGSATEPKYGPRMEQCAFWNELFPKFSAASSANTRTSNRYNSVDSEPPGGVLNNSNNSSSSTKSFNVDEHCFVALHNCSQSNFAIYVN